MRQPFVIRWFHLTIPRQIQPAKNPVQRINQRAKRRLRKAVALPLETAQCRHGHFIFAFKVMKKTALRDAALEQISSRLVA